LQETDPFQDLLFTLLAEVRELTNPTLERGPLEILDGPHTELVVQRLDVLRPQPFDGNEARDVDRRLLAQLLVVRQAAGFDQGDDLLGDALADTGKLRNAFDAALPIDLADRFLDRLDGVRCLLVRAWLELDALHV